MYVPTFTEALVAASRYTITIAVYVVSAFMDAIQYGLVNFPQTTRVGLWLVALYFGYKFSRRLVLMWWSVFVSMIRMVFFNLVILLVAALYIRGPTHFVIHDVPSIYSAANAFRHSLSIDWHQERASHGFRNYWGSENYVTDVRPNYPTEPSIRY